MSTYTNKEIDVMYASDTNFVVARQSIVDFGDGNIYKCLFCEAVLASNSHDGLSSKARAKHNTSKNCGAARAHLIAMNDGLGRTIHTNAPRLMRVLNALGVACREVAQIDNNGFKRARRLYVDSVVVSAVDRQLSNLKDSELIAIVRGAMTPEMQIANDIRLGLN